MFYKELTCATLNTSGGQDGAAIVHEKTKLEQRRVTLASPGRQKQRLQIPDAKTHVRPRHMAGAVSCPSMVAIAHWSLLLPSKSLSFFFCYHLFLF